MRKASGIRAAWLALGTDCSCLALSKEITMNARMKNWLVMALSCVGLASCAHMSGRDKDTATGAVIGGVAGAVLSGGSAVGAVGGAAVGGVIGHEIDPKK